MQTTTNYNFLIVLIVTFGSLTYGYNSAIIGAVIGLPSFFQYFNIDIKSEGGSRITGGADPYTPTSGCTLTRADLFFQLPMAFSLEEGSSDAISSLGSPTKWAERGPFRLQRAFASSQVPFKRDRSISPCSWSHGS
jgi:hypothetical protein